MATNLYGRWTAQNPLNDPGPDPEIRTDL